MGHAVFVSASQADLSLEGHVERARNGAAFVATLIVSDRRGRELGRRVLRAPGSDCRALEPALVLVIAIGLDPDAALKSPDSGNPALSPDTQALLSQLELPKASEQALRELAVPDPNPTPPPASPRAAAPSRPQAQPRPRPAPPAPIATDTTRPVTATIGISGELGPLPSAGLGGSIRIMAGIDGFWPVELALSALVPDRASLVASDGSAEVGLMAAGLSLCTPTSAAERLAFYACAGTRAGALRARGNGFADDRSANGPWFEFATQASTRVRFGRERRWLVQVVAGVGFPVIRDTFRYEDEQRRSRVLYRPAAVIGRIELGTGVSF